MAFAICRIQKIKSWGTLSRSQAHTLRLVDTPNANPEIKNLELIGNNTNLGLETLVREKIGSQKIRSDAVLAVEMLLSASPEYFRPNAPHEGGIYEQQRLDDFVNAVVKWLKKSWGDRIVQAELHLDEITPHIHAYLVPLDERGKLNCKALFGTRVKMYELQDSFTAAVAHLGIVRGVKGSVATHEKVRKYYSAVNQSSRILDWEQLIPQPEPQESSDKYRQRVIELLNPQLEIINCQLSERDRILQQRTEWKETASRSEELRQRLEKELRVLKLEQQDLPLEAIAYELGINPNEQFHGDALDLVMGINQLNFKDAVIWLRDHFDETPVLQTVHNHAITQAANIIRQKLPQPFVPPSSCPSHWQELENYLRQQYLIPSQLSQTLRKRDLIYADDAGNGVFIARNLDGESTGAYLLVAKDKKQFQMYPESRRSKGWFHLTVGRGNTKSPQIAILVSSPIDALHAISQNTPHQLRTMYLVWDDNRAPLPLELLKTIPKVIIAIPSEQSFTKAKQLLPHATKQVVVSPLDAKQFSGR
ncbi:plasmid recombination protein [Tolypothrix sp. FACHB-123]|uniref:MobV family relaxase n=1 Tax=Tolypothrix sp. FACHB-123 TaxID=2692868 RepID=UPI001683DD3E|nr:MobV family relaxase [Tolypothrix sp. FACHB-123]MBD2354794.1 plasmid recombination protein [Tolypothrix sp. FACHB-123]